MPRQRFENNAKSTLSVAVSSNTQASLTLQSGHGARFPYLSTPDNFSVTLDDGTNVEVCLCIDRSGDVLTVLRGQEGTTAQASFATGTKCELRLTRELMRSIPFYSSNMIYLRPVSNVNSYHIMGVTFPTQLGSRQAFTQTNSEWKTTQPLHRHNPTNSAQNPIGWRIPNNQLNVGRGFRFRTRFGTHIAPNSSHFFVGLVGTTGAVASVYPPSSLTDGVVIGYDNGTMGAQLAIYANDASGAAVKRSLGSYFTVHSVAAYELELSCVGSEARVDYVVRRLDIGSISEVKSYFTADIPANSLWLAPYCQGVTMVTSAIYMDHLGTWWDN